MRRLIPSSLLLRQGGSYFAIGLVQLFVDWLVFVILSGAGMAVIPANVAGRISGAVLGFWLNGRITFAGEGTAVGRRQLARFLVMWSITTVVSTASVELLDAWFGLRWAWLGKPVVDLLLSALQFALSRYWIYRR
jgi:putative flippase GtrA